MGGDDHDGCPVDKIAFAFGGWEHKEVSEIFKFDKLKCTDEDQAKAIYTSTYKAVKAKLAELKDKYSNEADHKTEFISNKYSAGEAIGQLEKVLEEFGSASGIEIKDEEPAGEMMEAAPEMMEEMMAEGGMTMEEAVKADPHAADSLDSYKGWENLPGLFLRTTTVYPYFGDLVKTTLLNAEFKHEDKPKDLDFAGCAGLLSAAINSSEGEEKEVFFSGYSGEEDYEQLAELITAKGNLVFPGWIAGWESKEAAFENAAKTQKEGVKYLTPLIYKIKSKVVSGVACRYFVSRLACKITGAK